MAYSKFGQSLGFFGAMHSGSEILFEVWRLEFVPSSSWTPVSSILSKASFIFSWTDLPLVSTSTWLTRHVQVIPLSTLACGELGILRLQGHFSYIRKAQSCGGDPILNLLLVRPQRNRPAPKEHATTLIRFCGCVLVSFRWSIPGFLFQELRIFSPEWLSPRGSPCGREAEKRNLGKWGTGFECPPK